MATPADAGRAIYADTYFPKSAKDLGAKLNEFKGMSDGAQRHVLAHLLYLLLQQAGLLTLRIEELLEQGDAAANNFEQLLAQVSAELPPHLQGSEEEEPEAATPERGEPTDDEPTASQAEQS